MEGVEVTSRCRSGAGAISRIGEIGRWPSLGCAHGLSGRLRRALADAPVLEA